MPTEDTHGMIVIVYANGAPEKTPLDQQLQYAWLRRPVRTQALPPLERPRGVPLPPLQHPHDLD